MDLFEPTPTTYLNLLILVLALPFWLIRVMKTTLFYLYLWQLKEYHIGRFIDHFRTAKGKQLFFNKILLGELVLTLFPVSPLFFLLYSIDALKAGLDIVQGRLRRPVFTKKIIPLIGVNIAALVIFLIALMRAGSFSGAHTLRLLLLYSVLVPVITSATVLAFQPFAVIARNRILRRAKEKREKFKDLKVIGITGSYGKTSTKEFLAHMLGQKFQVLKTPEHQNSEVGISNTILRSLTDEHEIFVCEMGAYNKGGIKLLADIAKPDIGIVTGVNEQHLATFGSMENLLSAEGGEELVGSLPKDGAAFINQNAKIKVQNYHKDLPQGDNAKCKILYYAVGERADFEAQDVGVEKETVSFRVENTTFRVSVYGGHNVQNLVGAIAVAREMGMSLKEIARACETITPDLGALKVKRGINGITIIDSTYSANPDGVIADLEYLNLYEGKKILVMPCLIELGKASKEVHKRIGEKIGEVCDLAIIITKERFRELQEGAMAKGMKKENILFLESPQEIVSKIKSTTQQGDVVLMEGRVPSTLIPYLKEFSYEQGG